MLPSSLDEKAAVWEGETHLYFTPAHCCFSAFVFCSLFHSLKCSVPNPPAFDTWHCVNLFFSLWGSLDEKLLQFMKALFVLLMTQKLAMLLRCDYSVLKNGTNESGTLISAEVLCVRQRTKVFLSLSFAPFRRAVLAPSFTRHNEFKMIFICLVHF